MKGKKYFSLFFMKINKIIFCYYSSQSMKIRSMVEEVLIQTSRDPESPQGPRKITLLEL